MNDNEKAAVEKLTTWLGEDGGLPVLRVVLARVAELEAQVEAQRASSQRHMNGRESYWVEQRTKWIAECDRIGESCKWHAARAEKAEAEAIARLRAEFVTMVEALGREDHPALDQRSMSIVPNNLRALLDAHAALEAAHTEALDALEKLQAAQKHVLEVMCAGEDAYMAAFDGAEAVLAKAGRR